MPKIVSHGITDAGLKRSNNEDAFAVEPALGYCIVADGMGGAAAGEVASRIFVETAHRVFTAESFTGISTDTVRLVFESANSGMISEVNSHPEYDGMGCTAELIAFPDDNYVLGHVGDSRTYMFRNSQLRQLTRDHSFVQDQLDRGLLSPEEARRHSKRHIILRAVGVNETVAVDLIGGKTLEGDLFLLCSDGLTDMVDDAAICHALTLPCDLRQKAERLVQLAIEAGGKDNITVVLCQVAGP